MRDSSKKKDAKTAPTDKVGPVSSNSKSLDATDFLQAGWRVAGSLLVPSFIGIWIDDKLGDGRAFTVVGVLAGVVTANAIAYRYVSGRFSGGGQ